MRNLTRVVALACLMVVVSVSGNVILHLRQEALARRLIAAVSRSDNFEMERLLRGGVRTDIIVSGRDTEAVPPGMPASPLHFLLVRGQVHSDYASRFVRNAQNINIAMTDGTTPLMLASERGMCSTVKVLLERRADANKLDDKGRDASIRTSIAIDRLKEVMSRLSNDALREQYRAAITDLNHCPAMLRKAPGRMKYQRQ